MGRCTLPTQDALIEPAARPARVVIDQERLLALTFDPAAYGLSLGQMLLADPLLAQLVARVCVSWSETGGSMRRWCGSAPTSGRRCCSSGSSVADCG
jgi:hypothetical protein